MPFLMEETCCYHPGRGWEETMQGLTHGYLHSMPSVCQPAPRNDEIMHTVMNSRKKIKHAGLGGFTSSLMVVQSSVSRRLR